MSMSIDASHVPWRAVRGQFEARLEEIKVLLIHAAPADVIPLQAEAKALIEVRDMFHAVARNAAIPANADDAAPY